MECYVPNNLNIDELLLRHPPNFPKGRKFKKEHLFQIIDLFCILPARNKDILTKDEFIPVCAARLNKSIFGYQYYLKYLIETGVLISDEMYVTDAWSTDSNPVKCIGYKFADEYNTSFTTIKIEEIKVCLRKNLDQLPEEQQEAYQHCKKWFNPHLKIDAESARAFTPIWYEWIKDKRYLWKDKEKKLENGMKIVVGKKDPKNALKYYDIAIDLFEKQEFFHFPDDKTYRFHSSITNLKKEYRNFITYNGQELVGLDLKNSQPYLSLLLFDTRFWSNNHPEINLKDLQQREIEEEIGNIWINYKEKYSKTIKSKHMIDRIEYIQESDSFNRYKDAVCNGTLYELVLARALEKVTECKDWETKVEILDREYIKSELIKIICGGNGYSSFEKRIITGEFPEPFEFFKMLKLGNKKRLSYLLQSIESVLFIQRIAGRFSQSYPNVPFYTIHDNIVTIKGFENNLHEIIIDELKKAIGSAPRIGVENWNLDNPRITDILN